MLGSVYCSVISFSARRSVGGAPHHGMSCKAASIDLCNMVYVMDPQLVS